MKIRSAGTAALLLTSIAACAVNPATGKREIMLVSEDQEITLGRQADQEVAASLGLYPDEALQTYVARIGHDLARDSERPELPWTFRIVDDPTVNAFALPGGFIYVTRGLLAHANSEAELAGVLGHEIGHVTARHSAGQMSKAQLATLGLGLGMVLEPRLRRFGDAAGAGLGLLFLRFSRDDEREADDLGLRYVGREGYDPHAMVELFETLERASSGAEGKRMLPDWLSTHPSPESRASRVAARVPAGSEGRLERQRYLARLDGLVYGEDPRQGFFRGNTFVHPGLRFEVELPRGWEYQNGPKAMTAVSPRQDAALVLGLSAARSAPAAADAFLASGGVRGQKMNVLGGGTAVSFRAQGPDGTAYAGQARFVAQGGRVVQFLAYGPESSWAQARGAATASLGRFRQMRQGSAPPPQRVDIVTVTRAMTVEEFVREFPSDAPAAAVARVNGLEPGETIPAGPAKRIVRSASR